MKNIFVIGGGAAGYFFAINKAIKEPRIKITILEQGKKVLSKVRVSGGGRCNVTHACFDPQELIQYYPRGKKELLGPFYHFGPTQLIEWFETKGVKLKTEADGRMFPVTDDAETIIQCFKKATQELGIKIITQCKVSNIIPTDKSTFLIKTSRQRDFMADKLFVATGSSQYIWSILANLGHTIIPPVPSLFTFKINDPRIQNLAGISVPNAHIKVCGVKLEADGPLLITHWGMSGPAILRLSAWGARFLHERHYRFNIEIDWLPEIGVETIKTWQQKYAKKLVSNHIIVGLPKRLWQNFIQFLKINKQQKWGDLTKNDREKISALLKKSFWQVSGKSTFKEEFVTAGGVDLREIKFNNFESKIIPNLFLAGEVINIDAITGGFNFQAAWTGAYLAATGDSN